MNPSDLMPGNVINNGFFDIEITETPRWNDTHNRWLVHGYRFVTSRSTWDAKCKLYGFQTFTLVSEVRA